ncbi:MAG: DUF4384 domain-containing protein [Nitrospirae bacterium]|nr:DUF4384 domain-containing protein [Nitrospirota bacterium]
MMVVFFIVMFVQYAYAVQSTITEAEGYSCLGDDKTRKQTEQAAFADAKRRAGEYAVSHIRSETRMKNLELEKDIIEAYMNASIKVLQEIEKVWYRDEKMGDCYRVKIKAEITPEERVIEKAADNEKVLKNEDAMSDPSAPLRVKVWADKKGYKEGDKIKIYLKGNKPFYVRVVYKDAGGGNVQLLPNPYRSDNYFNGGLVYEVPTGGDRFELEVTPPFGEENIIAYASTSPLGDIELKKNGGIFQVLTRQEDVGTLSRGVKITEAAAHEGGGIAEFAEEKVVVKTGHLP